MSSPTNGERLWAHIQSANTRWFKVSSALGEFAWRHADPGDPESKIRNPVRLAASWLSYGMTEAQTRWINYKLNRRES